jgi:hypothetical protein
MISEGRLLFIIELMKESFNILEKAKDEGDRDILIETIYDAREKLEKAVLHSRLLDKPIGTTDVKEPY